MIEKSIMGSPEEEYQNGRTDNLDEKCFNGYVNQVSIIHSFFLYSFVFRQILNIL